MPCEKRSSDLSPSNLPLFVLFFFVEKIRDKADTDERCHLGSHEYECLGMAI